MEADKEPVRGKFLYFALSNPLVEKEALSKLCEGMGIPYFGGVRLSIGDAFRSATGDIHERVPVTTDGQTNIYLACCRKGEELFEFCQRWANRKQIETICLNFLRSIEDTKLSITGYLYFVPRTYMERVDIFEDFITLFSGRNKNGTPLTVNSLYLIGDAKQCGKMTEEFYAAVKKEIAVYQERCDYLIKSGSNSPAVMDH